MNFTVEKNCVEFLNHAFVNLLAWLNTLFRSLFGTCFHAVIGGGYTFVALTITIILASRYNNILDSHECISSYLNRACTYEVFGLPLYHILSFEDIEEMFFHMFVGLLRNCWETFEGTQYNDQVSENLMGDMTETICETDGASARTSMVRARMNACRIRLGAQQGVFLTRA
ncbi:hypothetical protein Syun_012545 [Stephania yunnanensis]|uniref:Uncharacterized protein n=1 Tax=Stephania yunnanensis TaxID=152371 RepID=A0AAP0K1V5_9MAGN